MQDLDLTKDTVDQQWNMVDQDERPLGSSKGHMQYLEEKHAEHLNQELAKNAEAANERRPFSKLQGQWTSLSADLQQARQQNASAKGLLKGVKTEVALQKTASQQSILSHIKEREKFDADKPTIDPEFRQYRTDVTSKLGLLQAYFDNESRRANEVEKERKRLFLSDRSFKAHLWHRPDDSERVEGLQYQLNGAVGKECCAQKAV